MDDRDGPGIRTYVVVIGVIAMISFAALVVLGSQVTTILSTTSGGV
jgi:hypothetical protein